jgi:hypothetical protein
VPLPADANGATLPWRLLAELDSRGYINEKDLKRLTALRRQRNDAAHFVGSAHQPRPADIEYCLSLADRMLDDRYVSVDQMIDWYTGWAETTTDEPSLDQAQVRSRIAGTFPGAAAADLDEAVARLFQGDAR